MFLAALMLLGSAIWGALIILGMGAAAVVAIIAVCTIINVLVGWSGRNKEK